MATTLDAALGVDISEARSEGVKLIYNSQTYYSDGQMVEMIDPADDHVGVVHFDSMRCT